MNEREPVIEQEFLLERIADEKNARDDRERSDFLGTNLYHPSYLSTLSHGSLINEAVRLSEEFLAEKRDKNMGERFAMAISDKYAGKIHITELGDTIHQTGTELEEIEHQYHQLLNWMMIHELVDGEIPRDESDRMFHVEPTPVSDDYVIITRARPLVHGAFPKTEGEILRELRFSIGKRTVFCVSKEVVGIIAARHDQDIKIEKKETKAHWEGLLDMRFPAIHHIRTGFYLETDIVSIDLTQKGGIDQGE